MRKLKSIIVAVILISPMTVKAGLVDQGGGLIYDDELDITWVRIADLAAGSSFDDGGGTFGDPSTDGLLTWASATAFVGSVVFAGFDDWRLPTMDVNDDSTVVNCASVSQAECLDNELGYLYFYGLGGSGGSLTGDTPPFTGILFRYWGSDEVAPSSAWTFDFVGGVQGPVDKNGDAFGNPAGAWAVRSGDSSFDDRDGDGIPNDPDPDDDNDGVLDDADTDPLDVFVCQDMDADTCDDCAVGVDGFGPLSDFDPFNDGPDSDGDGICDAGDSSFDDRDGDGIPDDTDPDDDNDGVLDPGDDDPLDVFVCRDMDGDTCDDCAVGVDGFGPLSDFDPFNDGPDSDGDGICDAGDNNDDDSDGDGIDDPFDNCPTIANTDQADSNGDGFGDACVPADTIIRNGVVIGSNPVIGLGTVIRKDVTIGNNVSLGTSVIIAKNATLGDDVSIGDQSKIRKDVQVGNNVSIGDNVTVAKNSQIGDDVKIGNGTKIRKNVVIGVGAMIGDNVLIRKGATILSGATVPDGTVVPRNSTFP